MATLGTLHTKKLIDSKKRDVYVVDYKQVDFTPSKNIRPLNAERVQMFSGMFRRGEYVPEFIIWIDESDVMHGLDGFHRYAGFVDAFENPRDGDVKLDPRIRICEFTGTPEERKAFMINSSQALPVTPFERARTYQSMIEEDGVSRDRVAELCHCHVSNVNNHLMLLDLSPVTRIKVEAGEISYSEALKIFRAAKGDESIETEIFETASQLADSDGKTKIEPKHVKAAKDAVTSAQAAKSAGNEPEPPKTKKLFTKGDAMKFVEIICANLSDGNKITGGTLCAGTIMIGSADDAKDLQQLIDKYLGK